MLRTLSLLNRRCCVPQLPNIPNAPKRITRFVLKTQKCPNSLSKRFILLSFTPVVCESSKLLREQDFELHSSSVKLEKPIQFYRTRNLISLLLKQFHKIVVALASILSSIALNIKFSTQFRDLFNSITDRVADRSATLNMFAAIAGTTLLQLLSQFIFSLASESVFRGWATDIKRMLFERVIFQEMSFFSNKKPSEIFQRITEDVDTLASSVKHSITQAVTGFTQIIGSVYSMYILSPSLTGALLTGLPVMYVTGTFLASQLRRARKRVREAAIEPLAITEESITHIRTVKALVMERNQLRNWDVAIAEAERLKLSYGASVGAFQTLVGLSFRGVILFVAFCAHKLVQNETVSPGDLTSLFMNTERLQHAFVQLSMLFANAVKSSEANRNILEYLNLPVGFPRETASAPARRHQRAIGLSFNNVSFAYETSPDKPVLSNVSLDIPPGQVVALVGRSGAGKSTIVALIERLYDTTAGSIAIDGRKLQDIPLDVLRRDYLGYISQETQLFRMSVRENIRIARSGATDAEVEEAARLADADEFIRHLPQGYDTQVGQGVSSDTAGLSGGQKQRIAIARVLLKNSPIVLMDEATSSLDAQSEAAVRRAMKNALKNRTVLIVAHRLNTIRNADKIVVLDQGHVIEMGTHESLMAAGGKYADLVRHHTQGDLIE